MLDETHEPQGNRPRVGRTGSFQCAAYLEKGEITYECFIFLDQFKTADTDSPIWDDVCFRPWPLSSRFRFQSFHKQLVRHRHPLRLQLSSCNTRERSVWLAVAVMDAIRSTHRIPYSCRRLEDA